MNLIIAIIKPHKLDDVKSALEKVGVHGLTVSEVKGHGRQKGHSEIYRGTEYQVTYLPKLKVETVVPAELTDGAIEAISTAANSGQIGDGKIFISEIKEAIRIRTGETGAEAL